MLRRALGVGRGLLRSDPVLRAREHVVYGGEMRRALLMRALAAHDRSLQYRQWRLSRSMPHFYDHRVGTLLFAAGESTQFGLFRAFLTAQTIRKGDVVLDIGCGDGFFAHRFFAPRAAHVDAVDIEPDAIAHARRHHSAPSIAYHLTDAVANPFPRAQYDVIVWDGALGHFSSAVTHGLLTKIRGALAEDGVLVGSETLGDDGHDHLQFFPGLDDLRAVLGTVFPVVQLTQLDYGERREAYWRCALRDDGRLRRAGWC